MKRGQRDQSQPEGGCQGQSSREESKRLVPFQPSSGQGYHYLLHLGHALNALARYSEHLYEIVASKGVRAFLKYVRESLLHPWLDPERLYERLHPEPQLRLA